MYQFNFSISEISKLIQIQNVFLQELEEIESKFGDLVYEIGDDDFIDSRTEYQKRFDIYKYKIFYFVKLENEDFLISELLQWKGLICENQKTLQIYFYDLKSLETFVNNIIPGSQHPTSLRIKLSILNEFGYESGYEKLRILYEVENNENIKEDFKQFLQDYDLLIQYKPELQKIIDNTNSLEKITAFISKIENQLNNKNEIENLLNSVVDFISSQKINEEILDVLLEVIFDKLDEMNYS